jgi:hypothetical protein
MIAPEMDPGVIESDFMESPRECDPSITCQRGYYLHPELCECFLTCDYVMQCEAGYKWDFIECGCVVRTSQSLLLLELTNLFSKSTGR